MNYYFITGTSSGIGNAIVKELLQSENNFVFGFSRRNDINNNSFKHTKIDLSDLIQVSGFSFPNLKNVEKIVLINNAGTLGEIKHFGNLSSSDIITSFNVNITSVAILTNSFIKKYQDENTEKIIINISSGAAQKAYDGWGSYCTTKAGINMLTEVIDKEQAFKGFPIKTFAIAPGVVDTLMQTQIRNSNETDFSNIEKFHKLKSSKALYLAEDVAKQLVSFCENTDYINGLISRIEF